MREMAGLWDFFFVWGKIFLGTAGNKGTEEEDSEMLDPAKQETGNKEIVGRRFFLSAERMNISVQDKGREIKVSATALLTSLR